MRGICNGFQTDRNQFEFSRGAVYLDKAAATPILTKFHNEQIRLRVISSCQRLPDGSSRTSLSLCQDFIYIPERKQRRSFAPYQ